MKLPALDLHMLLAFDALLRERHVTRAAERLEVGQSSMSASLAKLRDLFHDELLMRAGTGLVPTERAMALLPRVQEALAAMERVLEPATPFDPATASHTFRMIVIDYINLLVMPSLMRRLRAEAPGSARREPQCAHDQAELSRVALPAGDVGHGGLRARAPGQPHEAHGQDRDLRYSARIAVVRRAHALAPAHPARTRARVATACGGRVRAGGGQVSQERQSSQERGRSLRTRQVPVYAKLMLAPESLTPL